MNYVFDTPDTNKKRKVNPWAIPVWVIDHPAQGVSLITAILGWAFFALHFLWTPFFILALILWVAASLAGISWIMSGVFNFFLYGGWENLKDNVRSRYERSQGIED